MSTYHYIACLKCRESLFVMAVGAKVSASAVVADDPLLLIGFMQRHEGCQMLNFGSEHHPEIERCGSGEARTKAHDVLVSIALGHVGVRLRTVDPHVGTDVDFVTGCGTIVTAHFDGGPGLDYISRIEFTDGTSVEYEDLNGENGFWPDNEPWFAQLSERLWKATGIE